ncbi:hypothetical protein Tco_1053121 [Tanacetum coccineum]
MITKNQGKRSYGDNGRRNATTNEPSSQALVAYDVLGGYDWSNDFDEPVNNALMAISSSSSSSSSDNEVQNYSKQCHESFKTLQKNFDSEREKHSSARLEIKGYKLALESLESRILGHEKNELAWGENYKFQNYKLKCREVRSSDEEIIRANDRFSKADGYHIVPPPIIRNFLTPRVDISFAGLDEYVIRKKIIESKTTELNIDTNKSKTSETVGKTNEVNIKKPKSVHESVVPKPKINRDKVIIEDWNSNDEDVVSAVKIVSPVKINETQTVRNRVDKIGKISQKEGIRFKKIKACFVYKSTDQLIKDCDFYAKNSPEPNLKTVVNNGQRVVKPVWDNAKRVNQQKFSNNLKYPQARRTFVRPNRKRAVHTVSTAKPISTARPVSTARQFALKIAQIVSVIRPIYPRMDNGNPESILQDHAVVDSGCSSHMTGNKAYLSDYKDYNGGFVAFGSDPIGGKIMGKGKLADYFVVQLRATYGAELVSAASLVNTVRPTLSTTRLVNDVKQINATVDTKAVVVTEALIRSSILFNDVDGTACLTNKAIFQNLALMGYEGDFNKLTFQKVLFSPQWKFLIHTILHCLSSKSTSWNEFSTNIASAVICLATNQKFNFSKLIFDGMLRNLDNTKKKFLMYPRFLMVFLNNQIELGEPFNNVYPTPAHNLKVFTNMSRKGLKFSRKITHLFPNMLTHAVEGEGLGEPTEPQPTLSPTQPSTRDQPLETSSSHATTQDFRDSLEGTNGNEGNQIMVWSTWKLRQSRETEEVKLTDDTKVVEDKSSGDKGGNVEELVSNARSEVSTARPDIDAARQEDSVVDPITPPKTTSICVRY